MICLLEQQVQEGVVVVLNDQPGFHIQGWHLFDSNYLVPWVSWISCNIDKDALLPRGFQGKGPFKYYESKEVGGWVRKWQFLLIYSTIHADVGGWVGLKTPKTSWRNTWMAHKASLLFVPACFWSRLFNYSCPQQDWKLNGKVDVFIHEDEWIVRKQEQMFIFQL